MTDDPLDALFDLLFLSPEGPLLASRMALRPDPAATSHFIDAPRPLLTREDMERPGRDGLMAELVRILDDLPDARRDEVIGHISALIEAFGTGDDGGPAEPSSLKYALH